MRLVLKAEGSIKSGGRAHLGVDRRGRRHWIADPAVRRRQRKPRPSDDIRGQVFYHGTRDEKVARQILATGKIVPPPEPGKYHLAPVPGRVYLTPTLREAAGYALGGLAIPASKIEREGRYGYIFQVAGEDLVSPHPDEDDVGEMVHYLSPRSTDYPPFNERREELREKLPWLRAFAEGVLSKHTLEYVDFGYLSWWAMAGKRILRELDKMEFEGWWSPETVQNRKLALIRASRSGNVASAGPVKVRAAYRVDKVRTSSAGRAAHDVLSNPVPLGATG